MNPLLLAIILQILAVGVIIAEFILPSAGILSITAAGLMVYSLVVTFRDVSPQIGLILVCADAIIIPVSLIIGLKLLSRSPFALKSSLRKDDGFDTRSVGLAAFVGLEGTALSTLRPSGIARISERRCDVVTKGEFIDAGEQVVVVRVEGNHLVVKKRPETPAKENNGNE